MAHPPLPQQRPPTATTPACHHRDKPTSTNATLKKIKKKKKHNQRDRHNHKSQTHRHHPKSQIHSTIPKSQITARWWQARSERPGRRDTTAFWPFSSWMSTMMMARALWVANSWVVTSPMPLVPSVIMATFALEVIVWRCGVCLFILSLLREELGIWCEKREKKSIKEVRGKKKPNKKHYFGFSICVRTVAICNGTDTQMPNICNI